MLSSSRRRSGGFTLIEAIVAMVIMATALTGLYSWISTDLISLRRAEAVTVTQEVVQEALRQLALVPLLTQPRGDADVGSYRLRWEARLAKPVAVGRTRHGAKGLYDVSLYDVAFSLHLEDQTLGQWSVRQLRYQRVRNPQQ